MKKCPNCGKLLSDDALNCDECNTKLEIEDTVSESKGSVKKDKSKIGELALKYSQGNFDIYEELYEEGYKLALRVAKSFMYYSYSEDMQDVAQEVTIKCINAISTMPEPNGFGGFLTNATKNKCRDFLKSAYFRHEKDNDTVICDEDGNETDWYYNTEDEKISYRPEEKLDETSKQAIIKEIMSGLSEGQRLAIIYRFYEGMSVKEIAEQLGEKETTIKGRLSTAKAYIGTEVEKIQKRDGIKLYSLSPIPFFLWLLGTFENNFPEGYAYGLASESTAVDLAVASESTTSAGSSIASEKAVEGLGKAKVAAIAASKKVAISAGAKIFISTAIGLGIVGGGIAISMNKNNNDAVVVEKTEETKEPENVKTTSDTTFKDTKKSKKKAKATATPSATPKSKSTPTPTVESTPDPVQKAQPQQQAQVQTQTQTETVVEQPTVRTPSSVSLSEVEAFIGYSDGQTKDVSGTRFTYKIWCASQGYTSQSSADSVMTSYSNSISNWPDSISYICLDDSGNLYLYEGENATNFVAECVVYGSSIN